jgi:hypothetical protein
MPFRTPQFARPESNPALTRTPGGSIEDFATVVRDPKRLDEVLTATQVKDTRESGSVTLNSSDVLDAIRHLFTLQKANPKLVVKLTFLTTLTLESRGKIRCQVDAPALPFGGAQPARLISRNCERLTVLVQGRGTRRLSSRQPRYRAPSCRLSADTLEKVFWGWRTKFSRAADAFRAQRCEGLHHFSEKRPWSFVSALRGIWATESSKN